MKIIIEKIGNTDMRMLRSYDGEPQALIHVDTFYSKEEGGNGNPIHQAVSNEDKVVLELKVVES